MCWRCIAGETVFPTNCCQIKNSINHLGIHQGIDQVGMFSHLDEVEMTESIEKNMT